MHSPHPSLLTLWLLLFAASSCSVRGDDTQETFFENRVRPLLVQHCHNCHGPDKQESDLRLDQRDLLMQGGSSGEPAAVKGDPAASMLLRYVRHEVDGMEMPPDADRLTDSEIATLEKWIHDGLAWPHSDAPTVLTMDQRLADHRESHWAFRNPIVASVNLESIPQAWTSWPQTKLDEYVLQRLLQNNMTPSRPAQKRTLYRRIKFGLIGLPPNNSDAEEFVSSESPLATQRLIERFLASPQYGERWGRHWLDVARYADTRGYAFQRDRNYPWAYTYRDYVIRAFNQDLPFNQFTIEQLAADLLPPNDTDNRSLAALGFLTVGRKFNNQHDDIDDKIDAVTRGFLGLTVACARCHDHKYDAIPTEDYYSLYGVFASSTEPSDLPLIGDSETLVAARQYEQRASEVENALNNYDDQLNSAVMHDAHTQIDRYLIAAASDDVSTTNLRVPLVKAWRAFLKRKASADEPTLMPWHRLHTVSSDEFATAASELAHQIATQPPSFLNKYVRDAFVESPPHSKIELAGLYGRVLKAAYQTWQEAGGDAKAQAKQPAELRQLLWYFSDFNSPAQIDAKRTRRYATEQELAKRSTLQAAVDAIQSTKPGTYDRAMVVRDRPQPVTAHVLIRGQAGRKGVEVARQAPAILANPHRNAFTHGSGRLDLAREITSPRNPLTARVFVNRVWLHHFGQPLVPSPSDFGVRCEPPLQQDVLDYLAIRFMEHDWSVKWLHREILNSATYQQSSGDRPDLYAIDPENRFLWRANRKRLGFEATRDALLAVSGQLDVSMGGPSQELFRQPELGRMRSIYGHIDRQDLPNLLRVFDFASPDQSSSKRTNTTVPQQALFFLNSPFVLNLARGLAAGQEWEHLSEEQTIALAFRTILARAPTERERKFSRELLRTGDHEKLLHVLMLTNEFAHVD